jgi:hypothetical protein
MRRMQRLIIYGAVIIAIDGFGADFIDNYLHKSFSPVLAYLLITNEWYS